MRFGRGHARSLSSFVLYTCVAGLAASCADDPAPAEGQWSTVASGLGRAVLAIAGHSEADVWAVGADKGQGPLALHYDGTAWTELKPGTRGALWWVHAVPGGDTWFAGVDFEF